MGLFAFFDSGLADQVLISGILHEIDVELSYGF